jgi:hypothetical protein
MLSRASAWQKANGGSIERALIATGAITEEALTSALSKAYNLPGVSRGTLEAADPGVVAALPSEERRRFRALPFALLEKRLKVATCDPGNPVLKKNLETETGFEVEFHIAPDPVIEDLLASFEGRSGGEPHPAPAACDPAASGATGSARHTNDDRMNRFPRFDSSCQHVRIAHFALCPRCGDVL